ncbi:SDR family oxidoreductase [Actinoplanes oblitus]|uniref:SDR family oxidoreductase n=1 Tax=Actinoplanes oblitus TaxID=3040509 RepID=A0ABY8WPM5_9ACTN|nr:SDR family oxidoreductase [Actinoplanes oblitus]WIM99831.1 SDR family oxidoreductase [Actinoplanes oblitus]
MDAVVENLFSLKGRRAVVTGGSSGIGRSIADALCRVGADVVIVARREEQLREVTEELRAIGGAAGWIAGDLGDRAGVHRVADEIVARHGFPDILVNSAGINLRPPLGELSEQDWDRTMRVNLDASFLLGQRFGPAMAEAGWGRIINLASQQSIRAFGNSGAYGVSKAAVAALTRSQAEAWSPRGVCANAIAPGFVHTPLTEPVFQDPARAEAMARRTMIGRNGTMADFTGVAIFLAGDASAYLTGQTIFVDGGFSAT